LCKESGKKLTAGEMRLILKLFVFTFMRGAQAWSWTWTSVAKASSANGVVMLRRRTVNGFKACRIWSEP